MSDQRGVAPPKNVYSVCEFDKKVCLWAWISDINKGVCCTYVNELTDKIDGEPSRFPWLQPYQYPEASRASTSMKLPFLKESHVELEQPTVVI